MEVIQQEQVKKVQKFALRKCKLSYEQIKKLRPKLKELVMIYSYRELKEMQKKFSQLATEAQTRATIFNIQMQTGVVPKTDTNEMKLDALYNDLIFKNQNLCDVQCAIRTFC